MIGFTVQDSQELSAEYKRDTIYYPHTILYFYTKLTLVKLTSILCSSLKLMEMEARLVRREVAHQMNLQKEMGHCCKICTGIGHWDMLGPRGGELSLRGCALRATSWTI